MIKTLKNKIIISSIIIIIIFFLGCVEAETTFQIGKFDISKSNTSTYEYDIKYNKMDIDINIINISQEIDPILEKEIIECGNKIGYYSICKVSKDEWHKIKNFIEEKRDINSSTSSCFKFGNKFGDFCYQFSFIRP